MPDLRYPQVNQRAVDVTHGISLINMAIAECQKQGTQAEALNDEQNVFYWRQLIKNSKQALERCTALASQDSDDTIWQLFGHFGISQK